MDVLGQTPSPVSDRDGQLVIALKRAFSRCYVSSWQIVRRFYCSRNAAWTKSVEPITVQRGFKSKDQRVKPW